MSGAEVLAGIGILCNAMQIVTFGRDALQVYRHMRDGGAPDPNLVAYLDKASASYKEMNERSGKPLPLTQDQRQVLDIGEEGYKKLQEFRRRFDKLYVDEKSRGGFRGKLRLATSGIKGLWRDKDFEDLEKSFQRHEQLLQTRLIHRICSQTDAAELLLYESFRHLDVGHQHIITQLAEGCTDLSNLILKQSTQVKDHVTAEHTTTRTHMVNHLATTEQNLQSRISESDFQVQLQKQHEQLLASLRYPDMNSRENQISENYPETFKWIFGIDDSSDTVTSSSSESQSTDENDEENESEENSGDDERGGYSGNENSDAGSSAACSVEPPQFPTWLESESKLFWISGKPASGKSTLMKFIASSPLTTKALESWRPDTQILIHCFWKAGHEIQQNTRGMLLSLIHQVLMDKIDLTRQLWEEKPFVRQRWAHSDWTRQELDDILCWTLQTSHHAVCIFIDGLDESSEFERLLWLPSSKSTVLDRIMKLDDVKVCVSSREEDAFCSYFEGVERLRIHELTRTDISRFADHQLQALPFSSKEDRFELLDRVVDRAEGVFLWVALVVDSVARGFRLNNDIEYLIQRVEHTPTELKKLFQDMWERSGDDGDIYRVVASRYFNLALTAREHCSVYNETDSLLCYAIASEDRTLESTLDKSREVTAMTLLTRCKQVEKELRVVCHGLLDVVKLEDTPRTLTPGPECLTPYSDTKVQFIHRSAVDFFNDTVSGSDLLKACGWSKDEAMSKLLAAILVRGRLYIVRPPPERIIALTTSKNYIHRYNRRTCVAVANDFISRDSLLTEARRDFIIETMRRWHHARLFPQSHWFYPGHAVFSPDSLDLEFLADVTRGDNVPLVIKLLSDMPMQTFLDAVPVVMSQGSESTTQPFLLARPILNRLLKLSEKTDFCSAAKVHEAQKRVIRLLYSWCCTAFLWKIRSYHFFDGPYASQDRYQIEISSTTLEVLRLFAIALPSVEDWHQPMPLYLRLERGVWIITDPLRDGPWAPARNTAGFVVTNYATAYQIALSNIRMILGKLEPEPKIPEGTTTYFQPIVIKSMRSSCALEPSEKDEIGALLQQSIETDSKLSESEIERVEGCQRLFERWDEHEVMSYLFGKLGHIEGLPIHPWTPGIVVQDLSKEDSCGRRSGSSSELISE